MRKVVVLPAPLGPKRPKQVCAGISRSKLSTAGRSPNFLETDCTETIVDTADFVVGAKRNYLRLSLGNSKECRLSCRRPQDRSCRVLKKTHRLRCALSPRFSLSNLQTEFKVNC